MTRMVAVREQFKIICQRAGTKVGEKEQESRNMRRSRITGMIRRINRKAGK